jgi:hypothetical protein
MASADLSARFAAVRARITRACDRVGRPAESVQLICVSKGHEASTLREAYALGQRDFGESYVQEWVTKVEALRDLQGLRWHFIGHLQSNKAKLVAQHAHVVHSVDSARLAQELGKRAAAEARKLDILVEVNVGGEAQKAGASPDQAGEVVGAARSFEALKVVGLMTLPPPELEAARASFRALVALQLRLGGRSVLPELSMGMSDDLEIAIEEGATMVRIGTALLGARQVKAK